MIVCTLVIVLCFISVAESQITVTGTCAIGPVYTFTVTNAPAAGVIFISGRCGTQATSATQTTYTFNTNNCAVGSGIPAIGTLFQLVIQVNANLNVDSDKIYDVVCTANENDVSISITANTGAKAGENKAISVNPTFTSVITNGDGSTFTSGVVGGDAKFVLSIPAAENNVFDFYVHQVQASVLTDSVNVLTAGCSVVGNLFPNSGSPTGGSLTLSFKLFIPRNTANNPSVTNSPVAVTFAITLKVCARATGGCTLPACNARRRRAVSDGLANNTESTVKMSTTVLVYPPGTKPPNSDSTAGKGVTYVDTEAADNVCLARAGFIGLLVAMLVVLVVVVGIGTCLFMRLRRSSFKGSNMAFANDAAGK